MLQQLDKAVTVAPVTLAKKADRVPAKDHFPAANTMVAKAQERIIPQPEKINACTGKSGELEIAPAVVIPATSQPARYPQQANHLGEPDKSGGRPII